VRRDTAKFLRAMDKAIMLDAAARLPSLRIASLLPWGQDDRFFTPELGRRLAAVLPHARLQPIAGARTFVPEDAPEELAAAIAGFVREGAAAKD
jgi:pimeloyl-ACP methyl ester carboxylesterase